MGDVVFQKKIGSGHFVAPVPSHQRSSCRNFLRAPAVLTLSFVTSALPEPPPPPPPNTTTTKTITSISYPALPCGKKPGSVAPVLLNAQKPCNRVRTRCIGSGTGLVQTNTGRNRIRRGADQHLPGLI